MKPKITPEQIEDLLEGLAEAERAYLEIQKSTYIELAKGIGQTRAAKLLGFNRKTLWEKLNKYNEELPT